MVETNGTSTNWRDLETKIIPPPASVTPSTDSILTWETNSTSTPTNELLLLPTSAIGLLPATQLTSSKILLTMLVIGWTGNIGRAHRRLKLKLVRQIPLLLLHHRASMRIQHRRIPSLLLLAITRINWILANFFRNYPTKQWPVPIMKPQATSTKLLHPVSTSMVPIKANTSSRLPFSPNPSHQVLLPAITIINHPVTSILHTIRRNISQTSCHTSTRANKLDTHHQRLQHLVPLPSIRTHHCKHHMFHQRQTQRVDLGWVSNNSNNRLFNSRDNIL